MNIMKKKFIILLQVKKFQAVNNRKYYKYSGVLKLWNFQRDYSEVHIDDQTEKRAHDVQIL